MTEKLKKGERRGETESVLSDGGIFIITPFLKGFEGWSWCREKRGIQSNIREESSSTRDCRFIRCNGNMLFSCFIGGILSTNFSDSSRSIANIDIQSNIALLRLQEIIIAYIFAKFVLFVKFIFIYFHYFHTIKRDKKINNCFCRNRISEIFCHQKENKQNHYSLFRIQKLIWIDQNVCVRICDRHVKWTDYDSANTMKVKIQRWKKNRIHKFWDRMQNIFIRADYILPTRLWM